MTAIVFDPLVPTTAYAGTRRAGLFKSVDGGQQWSRLVDPLLPSAIGRLALATDASLYVVAGGEESGVFKSTDGGATWSQVETLAALGIATDPTAAGTLYLTGGVGVLKSIDAGASWTQHETGLTDILGLSLAVDPVTPTTVYLGSWGDGAFKSADGGVTWSAVGAGAPFDTVEVLRVDPVTPATLYAVTQFEGVQKSSDSGATWADANSGLSGSQVADLILDPAAPANLWVSEVGRISRTTDGAASWTAAVSGVPFTEVPALALDPAASNKLLAGAGSGVLGSSDGGATWSPRNSGLRALFVDRLVATTSGPASLFASSPESGLFRSDDGGASWQEIHQGIQDLRISAFAGAPSAPQTLFAASSKDLWKSTDGGGTWSDPVVDPADLSPPGLRASAISVDPATSDVVHLGSSRLPGRTFRSVDGGENWSIFFRLGSGFRSFDLRSIAIDPLDPDHVLVGFYGPAFLAGDLYKVRRTTDGGATWNEVLSGAARADLSLAFDPLDSSRVYFANSDATGFEAAMSGDGGASWSALTIGAPCVQALLPDPAVSGTLWVGCDRVYTSTDAGASWAPFDDNGLPDNAGGVRSLATATGGSGSLHVGTHAGVFSYDFAASVDLSVTKTNGLTELSPGDPTTYTITVENAGPEDALAATVTDMLPGALSSCSWTCVATGAASCTAGPQSGDLADTVDLPAGESLTYSLGCTVDGGATGALANTASVAPGTGFADPSPGDNSATDTDVVLTLGACGELEDRALSAQTVSTIEVFEACNSITAGPAFLVEASGEVTFRAAGFVALRDGFSVTAGGVLVVENAPP